MREPYIGFIFPMRRIGIAIAAPVGPVAMLYINQSQGCARHFHCLGLLPIHYCGELIFGLLRFVTLLSVNWLQPACGTVLILMGIFIYLENQQLRSKKREFPLQNIISSWISAFFITILNPATIFAFLAVFVGLKIGADANHPTQEITIVCGVFIGASIWWLGLTTAAAKFGQKLSVNAISVVNRAGGALVAGCGVLAFIDWALI